MQETAKPIRSMTGIVPPRRLLWFGRWIRWAGGKRAWCAPEAAGRKGRPVTGAWAEPAVPGRGEPGGPGSGGDPCRRIGGFVGVGAFGRDLVHVGPLALGRCVGASSDTSPVPRRDPRPALARKSIL